MNSLGTGKTALMGKDVKAKNAKQDLPQEVTFFGVDARPCGVRRSTEIACLIQLQHTP